MVFGLPHKTMSGWRGYTSHDEGPGNIAGPMFDCLCGEIAPHETRGDRGVRSLFHCSGKDRTCTMSSTQKASWGRCGGLWFLPGTSVRSKGFLKIPVGGSTIQTLRRVKVSSFL